MYVVHNFFKINTQGVLYTWNNLHFHVNCLSSDRIKLQVRKKPFVQDNNHIVVYYFKILAEAHVSRTSPGIASCRELIAY